MSRKTMPTTTGVTTIGHDQHHAHRADERQLAHAQERQPEPEQRLDRDGRGHELERRPERARELRVVERLAVLAEADVPRSPCRSGRTACSSRTPEMSG